MADDEVHHGLPTDIPVEQQQPFVAGSAINPAHSMAPGRINVPPRINAALISEVLIPICDSLTADQIFLHGLTTAVPSTISRREIQQRLIHSTDSHYKALVQAIAYLTSRFSALAHESTDFTPAQLSTETPTNPVEDQLVVLNRRLSVLEARLAGLDHRKQEDTGLVLPDFFAMSGMGKENEENEEMEEKEEK